MAMYASYRLGTYREVRIWVKEKYTCPASALPTYALIASDGTAYRLPYSAWEWNPQKSWLHVKPGAVYGIRYWGMDVPELGLHRWVDRIYVIDDATESDVTRVEPHTVEL